MEVEGSGGAIIRITMTNCSKRYTGFLETALDLLLKGQWLKQQPAGLLSSGRAVALGACNEETRRPVASSGQDDELPSA